MWPSSAGTTCQQLRRSARQICRIRSCKCSTTCQKACIALLSQKATQKRLRAHLCGVCCCTTVELPRQARCGWCCCHQPHWMASHQRHPAGQLLQGLCLALPAIWGWRTHLNELGNRYMKQQAGCKSSLGLHWHCRHSSAEAPAAVFRLLARLIPLVLHLLMPGVAANRGAASEGGPS